jgi:prenyltransferase beta subunit
MLRLARYVDVAVEQSALLELTEPQSYEGGFGETPFREAHCTSPATRPVFLKPVY